MARGSLAYCAFDIEIVGEYCGIVQISAEILRINGIDSEREDEMNCFNEYARPYDNAIWNYRACETSHGLHSNYPSIVAAGKIESVWSRFHLYISFHISNNQKCLLIAWNGASYDKKWIYKTT